MNSIYLGLLRCIAVNILNILLIHVLHNAKEVIFLFWQLLLIPLVSFTDFSQLFVSNSPFH